MLIFFINRILLKEEISCRFFIFIFRVSLSFILYNVDCLLLGFKKFFFKVKRRNSNDLVFYFFLF